MARRKFHELSDMEQSRMILGIYLIIAIAIFSFGLYGLILYWDNTAGAITVEEYEKQLNSGSSNYFGMYSDGDTICIRERIHDVEYHGDDDYSEVAFVSDPSYTFKVHGDFRNLIGKVSVLTFTVKSVQTNIGGVNATYETIKEMDSDGILEMTCLTWSFYTDAVFYLATIGGLILALYALWKLTSVGVFV